MSETVTKEKKESYFGEEDFPKAMLTVVTPWREEHLKEGYFTGYDGTSIHYLSAIHPQEKAAIVIAHGFCEFAGKYHEMMYYMYREGYSVFFIEHRGHGFSGRKVQELDKVYVKSYEEYVLDFKIFMDQIVSQQSISKRYILFAHSMGGAIATLFLEECPGYFPCAVLSSPMEQMDFRGVPDWKVKLLMLVSRFLPWEEKYVPGQHGYTDAYTQTTSSSMSKSRYDYAYQIRAQIPQCRTFGGTYAWTRASIKATKLAVKNAGKVKIPVLLLQAGQDTMVKPMGQEIFARDSANTTLIRFPESKHEIFNATDEIRQEYYETVFAFLNQQVSKMKEK